MSDVSMSVVVSAVLSSLTLISMSLLGLDPFITDLPCLSSNNSLARREDERCAIGFASQGDACVVEARLMLSCCRV